MYNYIKFFILVLTLSNSLPCQSRISFFDNTTPSIQNIELNQSIRTTLNELQHKYSKQKNIVEALDDAKFVLENYDLTVDKYFQLIQNQLKNYTRHEKNKHTIENAIKNEFLFTLKKQLQSNVLKFKNSDAPLTPTSIIRLESSEPEFKEKPWYVASFVYSDESSGTTGGLTMPHLAIFRLPEFIDTKEADFPPDYFLKTRLLSKIDKPFLFRPHSACFMSEIFNHDRCDCAQQLKKAMQRIEENEFGLIFYLQQEARGAGLTDKMLFYTHQSGRNTEGEWLGLGVYDANQAMTEFGFDPDKRKYQFAIRMLKGLGITNDMSISMLSHNPLKAQPFIKSGYNVKHVYESVSLHSIEALCETIKLKIIDQGHFIAFDQMEILLTEQISKLKLGERIDQRLYNTLIDLKYYLLNNPNPAHICPELLSLMREIDSLLIIHS